MPQNMPELPDFPVLRKGGIDPRSVEAHLTEVRRYFEQKVAAAEARYGNLEIELDEARKREEAVHLTLVAATKTKEEMLTNAQREAEQMVSSSKEQSESLLAEAKKEAFRLVSEARQSAEAAATAAQNEVTRIRTEAEEAAEATRNAARREAIEMIDTVESDTAALMAAQEATIADMRRKYEEEEAELAARVEVLRATAADLEARLKAIATGSLGQATTLVTNTPAQPASAVPVTAPEPPTVAPKAQRPAYNSGGHAPAEVADVHEDAVLAEPVAAAAAAEVEATVPHEDETLAPAASEHVATVEEHELIEEVSAVVEPVAEVAEIEQVSPPAHEVDEEPAAVPAAVTADTAEEEIVEKEPVPAAVGAPASRAFDDADEGSRKGSYYSRRSAKLPRIGTEAGRSALAAANAIRGATRGEPTDPHDVTAQTA